jgi:ABC-2 type transport system permease protein
MNTLSEGGFLRRLLALTRKEFRQLLRDPSNIAIGIVLPIVLILIFGYGLSLDVKDAPVAIVLEDSSPTAADAVASFQLSPTFAPVVVASMHEGEALLMARKVDAVIRVPADFSRKLFAGQARAQVIVHGADASRAAIILNYSNATLAQWAVRQAERRRSSARAEAVPANGSVQLEQRMWFNAANTSTWYLVPGLVVLIMTLVGAFLTALVMAREWERGTLEALFVTPVRAFEIFLAKIAPYFTVGVCGLVLCLLAAHFLFHVPMLGSMVVIVLSSMLYLIVAVGMGLLISCVTKNQFLASQAALLSSFMPSLMLSGFLFDLRNVPWVVRAVGKALPATYFMELLKTLFLAGNVWPLIFRNCAVLLAYAVLLLGLARLVTRKQLD